MVKQFTFKNQLLKRKPLQPKNVSVAFFSIEDNDLSVLSFTNVEADVVKSVVKRRKKRRRR